MFLTEKLSLWAICQHMYCKTCHHNGKSLCTRSKTHHIQTKMAGFTSPRISLRHIQAFRTMNEFYWVYCIKPWPIASKKMGSYHLTNTPKKKIDYMNRRHSWSPREPTLTYDEANLVYEYSHFLKTNSTIRFPFMLFYKYITCIRVYILFTMFAFFCAFSCELYTPLVDLRWSKTERFRASAC